MGHRAKEPSRVEGIVLVTSPIKYKSGLEGYLTLLVLLGPQNDLLVAMCYLPILTSFP